MGNNIPLLTIPDEELEIHVEQDLETGFIARVLHRPSLTLKISDWWPSEDEAVKQAKAELTELLSERLKGLGSR